MHRRRNHVVRHVLMAMTALFAGPMNIEASPAWPSVVAPDGVTLAVQESGDPTGTPIIFIHGLLGSHVSWDAQVNSARLQHYRLITYDLRGHGLSGKPVDPESYRDGRQWAADLAAVIEASHARKAILVGWSLGGTVISNYLAAYGDSHIGGAVYVDGVIELKPDQIVAHPDIYRDMVAPDLATHLDAERTFLTLCFYKPPAGVIFERLLAIAAMASWDMQRAVLSMTVDVADGLGKTHVPVLLIYGARDALIKAEPTMARAAVFNSRIQRKLYEESGHSPFLEEPQRFNRDLDAFIKQIAAR